MRGCYSLARLRLFSAFNHTVQAPLTGCAIYEIVMQITIDWASINTEKDFYNTFLAQVQAPAWHGQNLDALQDSLVNGGINDIEPPYNITNLNVSLAPKALEKFMCTVFSIFAESALEYAGSVITIQS